MGKNKCDYCHEGYTQKNGIYIPCKHCITPARFSKTLDTAIANCQDSIKRRVLIRIKRNLPDYPVMALLEAESYIDLSGEFVKMLRSAFDIKPFMDVKYKEIK